MPSIKPAPRSNLGKLRGIIFDWDGVLAVTMEGNFQAWFQAFAPHGITVPRHEYFLLEGMSAMEVARHFLKTNGLGLEAAAEIRKRKDEIFLEKNQLVLYPEVTNILTMVLQHGISMALVTGASRTRLAGSGALEFLSGFKTIVTADDVKNGKPDPESYVKSLKGLQLSPWECLVIENAPFGIRAAKQAGIPVLALTTTLAAEFLQEADWILGGLEAFPNWLEHHADSGKYERHTS